MKKFLQGSKLPLSLVIALVGFPQISETIYTPALPIVAKSLEATVHAAEATLSIYFLGFALGVLIWGFLSDQWGRRLAMLAGLVIYGLGSLGCSCSHDIGHLLAFRFIQAFGASVGSVITQTMLRDLYEGQQRARLFSIVGGALAFSPAIGPVIGGYLSEYGGWRANLWLLVAFSLFLFLWSYIKLPETKNSHSAPIKAKNMHSLFVQMVRSSAFWGHVLLIGGTNGILFSFYEEAPFLFVEQLGLRPSEYGMLGLVIAAASVLAARLSYRFNSYCSNEQIIQWGSWISLGGGCLFLFSMETRPVEIHMIWLTIGCLPLLVLFLGIGLIIPNSLSIAMKPYQAAIGTAGSLFGGFYYILIAGYTWLISVLHNGASHLLPLYLTGLALTLLLGSFLIRNQNKETAKTFNLTDTHPREA